MKYLANHLKNHRGGLGYNVSPEAFSRHLMALEEHSLDEEGRMTVHNDTAGWCHYIDITLKRKRFGFIDRAIV
jgi:hypothetical protein